MGITLWVGIWGIGYYCTVNTTSIMCNCGCVCLRIAIWSYGCRTWVQSLWVCCVFTSNPIHNHVPGWRKTLVPIVFFLKRLACKSLSPLMWIMQIRASLWDTLSTVVVLVSLVKCKDNNACKQLTAHWSGTMRCIEWVWTMSRCGCRLRLGVGVDYV